MSWIWLLSFFLQDSIWVFFRRCVMFASPIALSGRWRCLTVLRKNSELVTASVTRHNLRWNSILIGLQLLLIWNRTTDESTCTKAECTQQRKAICPFCYRSYFLGIFRIRGRKKKKSISSNSFQTVEGILDVLEIKAVHGDKQELRSSKVMEELLDSGYATTEHSWWTTEVQLNESILISLRSDSSSFDADL